MLSFETVAALFLLLFVVAVGPDGWQKNWNFDDPNVSSQEANPPFLTGNKVREEKIKQNTNGNKWSYEEYDVYLLRDETAIFAEEMKNVMDINPDKPSDISRQSIFAIAERFKDHHISIGTTIKWR